ncbi:MAG TPA: FAD-dependent oxidoreductase, partial [Pseudolabrys sp.]
MTDRVIIIGGGIAGLATALRLAPLPVTLIAGAKLATGAATAWAQGGVAAAIGADDDPALHAA